MTPFDEALQGDARYLANMARAKGSVKDWRYLLAEVGSRPLHLKYLVPGEPSFLVCLLLKFTLNNFFQNIYSFSGLV